jgi:diguanylate cyclase (GGDEF)-like protein
MNDTTPKRVLLLADSHTLHHWSEGLAADDLHIWRGHDEIPGDELPDVLVTNYASFDLDHDYDAGVVFVGDAGRELRKGDIHLPHDCSVRELAMACRLMAENTQLRRRARAADEMHRVMTIAAVTDPLTMLANRRAWDVAVSQRRTAALEGHEFFCMAVLDLDCFKPINDTFGHLAGDNVLVETARVLVGNVRHEDFVARLGGDEFGLLLFVPSTAIALAILNRLRIAVAQQVTKALDLHLTASIGFAIFNPSETPWSEDQWYHAADEALAEAKKRGRDCVMGG